MVDPAVAVPLVGLGALALLKTRESGPGEKGAASEQTSISASLEKTASANAEPVPPPSKSATASSVQTPKPESQTNVSSPSELLKALEAKLLPVPDTNVLMSATELTVGEWKVYLKAQKLGEWKAPLEFLQTDTHPVVEVSSTDAANFCRWLSSASGATWRLPTNQEWDAASPAPFPWGESFPPLWNEGNYAIGVNGSYDSAKIGADGIFGTAPVGSFKPNSLGFYDLGGNVAEWVSDGVSDGKNSMLRGAGWMDPGPTADTEVLRSKHQRTTLGVAGSSNRGFRVVCVRSVVQKAVAASTPAVVPVVASSQTPAAPVAQNSAQASVPAPQPPKGFRAIFDGATLSGWYGLNPHEVETAPAAGKAALIQQQKSDFPKYWRVERGELVSSGIVSPGSGPYATAVESFGNIDLLIEYKIEPKADGGIYLRGTPQIQIWDPTQSDTGYKRPSLGSGGLYNNAPESLGRYPLVRADRPCGDWNQFRIRQVGARTWVWLNEKLVVDGVLLDPFWDKTKPLPEKAPILLQAFGGEIRYRNIFVRDIPDLEAGEILKAWNAAHVEKKVVIAKSALQELVNRLEAKLIPIPGTQVRMCKTECTVGEWKLYLKEAGLRDWQQPDPEWNQADDHPVVKVTWEDVTQFSDWLSAKTGKEWRLPTLAEWDAAVGKLKYPWGDYFPPNWDDGNFCFAADGTYDPQKVGIDGIKGTAPVGSFKPNALGFYDLGGNAMEWMLDSEKGSKRYALRGGGWRDLQKNVVMDQTSFVGSHASNNIGFRLVQK